MRYRRFKRWQNQDASRQSFEFHRTKKSMQRVRQIMTPLRKPTWLYQRLKRNFTVFVTQLQVRRKDRSNESSNVARIISQEYTMISKASKGTFKPTWRLPLQSSKHSTISKYYLWFLSLPWNFLRELVVVLSSWLRYDQARSWPDESSMAENRDKRCFRTFILLLSPKIPLNWLSA